MRQGRASRKRAGGAHPRLATRRPWRILAANFQIPRHGPGGQCPAGGPMALTLLNARRLRREATIEVDLGDGVRRT
jgi:hypothetical protein